MKRIYIILVLVMILLLGCNKENIKEKNIEDRDDTEEKPVISREMIDLDKKPNELGEIMVLMYHNIGSEESEWTRTEGNFKKDLETLYEEGYRAVSLEEYVKDTMNIELGKTPVIITFDDGNENNFRVEEKDGKYIIDENSALGIMEKFNDEYPDFNMTASFFVMGEVPFGDSDSVDFKLDYLVNNGYDIGNHTMDHRNMKDADGAEYIEEALGGQVKNIQDIIPNYDVNTYAICYGARPKDEGLYRYLEKGSYDGTDYKNIAIVNVGWNPGKSPLNLEFDPLSIPRIRASEIKVDNVGLYDWLEYFRNNEGKRYISDGFNEIITIPKEYKDELNKDLLRGRELYLY